MLRARDFYFELNGIRLSSKQEMRKKVWDVVNQPICIKGKKRALAQPFEGGEQERQGTWNDTADPNIKASNGDDVEMEKYCRKDWYKRLRTDSSQSSLNRHTTRTNIRRLLTQATRVRKSKPRISWD